MAESRLWTLEHLITGTLHLQTILGRHFTIESYGGERCKNSVDFLPVRLSPRIWIMFPTSVLIVKKL